MSLLSAIFNQRRNVRVLDASDAPQLRQWLARTPGPSAFLLGWLNRYPLRDVHDSSFFELIALGADDDWELVALHVHGALVAMVGDDSSRAWHLGRFLSRHRARVTTLVGPDQAVAALSAALRTESTKEPRFEQAQTLLARNSQSPALPLQVPPLPRIELATMQDWNTVLSATLSMHEEETGLINLQRDRDGFARSTRQKIREQRVWVLREEDSTGIIFKASASLPAEEVLQLEGIWTAPAYRRRGIAFQALSALCTTLHEHFETLSLYTSADNEPALRLYAALGFREEARWRTVYLD